MQAVIKLDGNKAIFQQVRKVPSPDNVSPDKKATGYAMGSPYRRIYYDGSRYWCTYQGKRRIVFIVE